MTDSATFITDAFRRIIYLDDKYVNYDIIFADIFSIVDNNVLENFLITWNAIIPRLPDEFYNIYNGINGVIIGASIDHSEYISDMIVGSVVNTLYKTIFVYEEDVNDDFYASIRQLLVNISITYNLTNILKYLNIESDSDAQKEFLEQLMEHLKSNPSVINSPASITNPVPQLYYPINYLPNELVNYPFYADDEYTNIVYSVNQVSSHW